MKQKREGKIASRREEAMDATTLLITGIRGLISVLGQIQDLLADLCAAAQMLQKIEKVNFFSLK